MILVFNRVYTFNKYINSNEIADHTKYKLVVNSNAPLWQVSILYLSAILASLHTGVHCALIGIIPPLLFAWTEAVGRRGVAWRNWGLTEIQYGL